MWWLEDTHSCGCVRLGTACGDGWICLDKVHHGGMGHMAGYDKVHGSAAGPGSSCVTGMWAQCVVKISHGFKMNY